MYGETRAYHRPLILMCAVDNAVQILFNARKPYGANVRIGQVIGIA